jgi:uncharacterized membrane protein YjjB (DUF3815 family)
MGWGVRTAAANALPLALTGAVFLAALCFAGWASIVTSNRLKEPARMAMGTAMLILGGSLVYLIGTALAAR